MAAVPLQIELLGGFGVRVDGRSVADDVWRRRKPAAVVKLLALEPNHRLHREQLGEVLWPELEPAAASANLRKAIHFARSALDVTVANASATLVSDGEFVALVSDDL